MKTKHTEQNIYDKMFNTGKYISMHWLWNKVVYCACYR